MTPLLFRASSFGKLMTEPKTKSEGPLSVGARTHVRELAAQEIFGVDFEADGKALQKGIQCEDDSIALYNRVYGKALVKNVERRRDEFFQGESDLPDVHEVADIKTAWSASTFPLCRDDISTTQRALYDFQLRVYMRLWNKQHARLVYCLVDTPEALIGYEPMPLHIVGHIPEHLRVTTWTLDRDMAIEAAMVEKVKSARLYYAEVIREFERTHPEHIHAAPATPPTPTPAAQPARELAVDPFA